MYKSKGYISGSAHRFVASVSSHPAASAQHVIEGTWTGTSNYTKSHTKALEKSVFMDATGEKEQVQVAPIEQQGPMESRRVWKETADGIRAGDFEKAGLAKSKLENEQRAKRKEEKEQGTIYQLANFSKVEDDEECKFGHVSYRSVLALITWHRQTASWRSSSLTRPPRKRHMCTSTLHSHSR